MFAWIKKLFQPNDEDVFVSTNYDSTIRELRERIEKQRRLLDDNNTANQPMNSTPLPSPTIIESQPTKKESDLSDIKAKLLKAKSSNK